jgi:hypothetical protein
MDQLVDMIFEEIFLIISLVGGGQGLFLTAILFTRKKNVQANRILALLIFSLTCNLLISYCITRGTDSPHPYLVLLMGFTDFFLCPSSVSLYRIAYLLNRQAEESSSAALYSGLALLGTSGLLSFFTKRRTESLKPAVHGTAIFTAVFLYGGGANTADDNLFSDYTTEF